MILAIGKIKDHNTDTRTPVKFSFDPITGITAAINNNGDTVADYPCLNETEALYYWRQDRNVSIDSICA
jgi:hypothetical protein